MPPGNANAALAKRRREKLTGLPEDNFRAMDSRKVLRPLCQFDVVSGAVFELKTLNWAATTRPLPSVGRVVLVCADGSRRNEPRGNHFGKSDCRFPSQSRARTEASGQKFRDKRVACHAAQARTPSGHDLPRKQQLV